MGREELDPEVKIGIIGGGASAVCMLEAMAEANGPAGGITIFELGRHLWRGRPYQPDLDAVRVNIPPYGMSVRFGDRGHFQRWLERRGARDEDPDVDRWSEMRFVSRALFGTYLEETARATISRLRLHGWQVEVVRERVDLAARTQHGVFLRTESGRRVGVGHAILCVGRGGPTDNYRLTGSPGFVADPYPLAKTLADIDPESEVGVLGSGLTGVDVVLALESLGHRGHIRLLSRSGVLPMVRQRRASYELRRFTPDTFRFDAARGRPLSVDRLVQVMREEFAEAGEDLDALLAEIAVLTSEDPVRRLRRSVAAVESPTLGLRILQQAVPTTGPDVWAPLPEEEKEYLLRRWYRTAMSVCCPMPASTARTLLRMIDAKRVDVQPGVRHLSPAEGGGFTVGTTDGDEFRVDVVVNAVNGSMGGVPPAAAALMASLVSGGSAQPHPCGGVRVDRATSRLVADGEVDPRLYALGDLAAGSLFFTFGLPSLVDRAHDIVGAILRGALPSRADPRVSNLQTV